MTLFKQKQEGWDVLNCGGLNGWGFVYTYLCTMRSPLKIHWFPGDSFPGDAGMPDMMSSLWSAHTHFTPKAFLT